jgi:hypothetical protein
MEERQYILACDERGTTRWPNATKTWTLGGFVVNRQDQAALISAWSNVKLQLCGSDSCELKWSHFFPGVHQSKSVNPLRSTDPQEWRDQAQWALTQVLNRSEVYPLTIILRKDRASSVLLRVSDRGKQVLDVDTIWVSVLGQFALFLEQRWSDLDTRSPRGQPGDRCRR